jgi:hypothetical protein
MSNLTNNNFCQVSNGSWQTKLKNKFNNNPKLKTAILLSLGIVIGLASCNFYQKKQPPVIIIHRQPSIFSPFHHPWFDDYFYQDFYQDIKDSQKLLPKTQHNFSANLTQKQDENFHYYILNFSSINPQDIIINNTNSELVFKADNQQQNTNNSINSSFYYSVSLPKNYNDPEIIKNNQEIIVKFKKPSSTNKESKTSKNNAKPTNQ